MTLKDISVALRRALTLTPQHSPVFCRKGGERRRLVWSTGDGHGRISSEFPLLLRAAAVSLSRSSLAVSNVCSSPRLSAPCCVMQDHPGTQKKKPTATLSASAGISMFVFRYVKAKIVRLALHFLHHVGVTQTPASQCESLKMWLRGILGRKNVPLLSAATI